MGLFQGELFVGYAALLYTHPLTAMDMFPGNAPTISDRALAATA